MEYPLPSLASFWKNLTACEVCCRHERVILQLFTVVANTLAWGAVVNCFCGHYGCTLFSSSSIQHSLRPNTHERIGEELSAIWRTVQCVVTCLASSQRLQARPLLRQSFTSVSVIANAAAVFYDRFRRMTLLWHLLQVVQWHFSHGPYCMLGMTSWRVMLKMLV